MAKTKQIVRGKALKKEWHPIKSTKAFNSTPLGESYVTSAEQLINRHLTVNLANLTGDIRQQGISLYFKVSEIDEGAGVADVVGYESSSAQLKRLVKRGVERLDDSISCVTSDGKRLKIKPFAVTRNNASKYKMRLMRNLLKKNLVKEVGSKNYTSLLRDIISNQLQTTLKSSVKKISPLRALAIRKLELVEDAGAGGDSKAEKAAATEGEAKQEESSEKREEPEKEPEPEKTGPES